MAHQFASMPVGLENNSLYKHLVETAKDGDKFDKYDLIVQFGERETDEVLEHGILGVKRELFAEVLKLSFTIMGTQSFRVLEHLENKMYSFKQLKKMLPGVGTAVSTGRLKNTIIFLANFQKIQYFTLPCSGVTIEALENNPEIERQMDRIYKASDHMEPQFIYQSDLEEGLAILAASKGITI